MHNLYDIIWLYLVGIPALSCGCRSVKGEDKIIRLSSTVSNID